MTHVPKVGSFVKMMLFGYKTQQRENWIQSGKVDEFSVTEESSLPSNFAN